ncbi:MAG: nitrilase family protein [Muribaculaceae bacterium]|nr:nitrilase family protein [Muribaculaceae bacterium]
MSTIKVAMLPLDIKQADPDRNIAEVMNYAGNLDRDTDILALPELFSTGFIIDTDEAVRLSETIDGRTITTLRQIARKGGFAVTGSFICRVEDGTLRNRAFFINPDAPAGDDARYYDKHHLFVLSDEKRIFEAGEVLPPITHFRGWNIAVTVCYDLRFPVWMRNTGCRYDMMIVPANWPDSRAYAWRSLLVARAIENQAIYIGVNRSGVDDFGTYSPDLTVAADALGALVDLKHTDIVRYATFSLDTVNTLRKRFPVHLNADPFTLM